MANVVTTTGLTRRFGAITAVDGLRIEVPAAGVIGLVGPNGSGKSTLIRMLLGLIRPTSGNATVLGLPITSPTKYASRVGALVESPAFVSGLSARVNLVSLARLRRLPPSRVDEVLSIVGLTGRDKEPVGHFSLGMKQRLGIAAALLPDPELLILDEPTNGLDPAGIVEIRGLLRSLGAAGHAVIVASHLLAEVQVACDYLVVIRFGKLVFAGPMSEMLARSHEHIDVRAEHTHETEGLRAALVADGWEVGVADHVLRVAATASRSAALNRAATVAGFTLSELVIVQDSLEDIFLTMTGRTDGELATARAATPLEAAP